MLFEILISFRIETVPLVMKPIVPNPLFQHKNVRDIPVPRGDTPYCKAKRAEYIERYSKILSFID